MDIRLDRRSDLSLRDQLIGQLQMHILAGSLTPGQRLPSLRALARRLKLNPCTVSAAYRQMHAAGHVVLRPGSGVFVKGAPTRTPEQAEDLDEMIRRALQLAVRKGMSLGQIRQAVERWLRAGPPERIVVVDPSAETATLLASELGSQVPVRVEGRVFSEVERDPALLVGCLALALPLHVARLRGLAPGINVKTLHIQLPDEIRELLVNLRAGSSVLVVCSSPGLVPAASVLFTSLCGPQTSVEVTLLSEPRAWRPLLRLADLVVADAVSFPSVQRRPEGRVHEARLIPEPAVERLKKALLFIAPKD